MSRCLDITFCSAKCLNADCHRNTYVVELVIPESRQSWGVSMTDFSSNCDIYEEDVFEGDDQTKEVNFN